MICFLLALILATNPVIAADQQSARADDAGFRVLVFTKTEGFHHPSIEAGVDAIQALGKENDFGVDVTDDATVFSDSALEPYRVVVWLSTTGDVLTLPQQEAFERYIMRGGGYAGVHSAADTEYEWPWYGALVGAYFSEHPAVQPATIVVADHSHPSTAHLGATWYRSDEWYSYRTNPRPDVHVLLTLDESSYTGGAMGADHPISWCHRVGKGHAWYTGLGHTPESFTEPAFVAHLLGGIRSAAGVVSSDCATVSADHERGWLPVLAVAAAAVVVIGLLAVGVGRRRHRPAH